MRGLRCHVERHSAAVGSPAHSVAAVLEDGLRAAWTASLGCHFGLPGVLTLRRTRRTLLG
jgi:hypothetical protein